MIVDAGPAGRVYRLVDGRPRTVALVADGREIPVDGPELTVVVDGRRRSDADLRVAGSVEEAPD
ncbi:MAG: hypothetical protein M3326_02365, partial [Actinomycetota bacterium]|nr:hypothetical protein [Actinomycetota bacterium]